jgi:hypothetical protein
VGATIEAVTGVAAGSAAAVSTNVAALTQGVVKAMLMSKLKIAVGSVVALVVVCTGIGLVTQRALARPGDDSRSVQAPAEPSVSGQVANLPPPVQAALPALPSPPRGEIGDRGKPAPKEQTRLMLKEAEELVTQQLRQERKIIPSVQLTLKELTTDEVWKRLGVQVFQVTGTIQAHETFVIRQKKAHQIGYGFGGHGVTSLCVAALNKDKRPELVYAYSFGSGVHRSHVAVFDCLAQVPREFTAPQAYFGGHDLAVKRIDDQNVRVLAGEAKIGRLVMARKEGDLMASIEFDKDLNDTIKRGIRETKPGTWNEAKSADVCEALFRFQFLHNKSAVQQKAKAYFLSIEGKDPANEFLARFKRHQPEVRLGSAFQEGEGLKFRIESLTWIDDSTVEARGGYYEGNLSASGNLYRIVRKDGKWIVESDKLEWIS